jgi:hypothetical protein
MRFPVCLFLGPRVAKRFLFVNEIVDMQNHSLEKSGAAAGLVNRGGIVRIGRIISAEKRPTT